MLTTRHLPILTILVLMVITVSCAYGETEFRGAWISAWSPGYYTAEQVDKTIAAAKTAGLNALFIQVRKNADAYYDSKIEPRASDIASDFDPLAYTIEKAHAKNIKVFAWINAFRVWTARDLPSDPTHLVNAYPDWINRSYDGKTRASEGLYLDPGIPDVRDYITSIVLDIASRYDVDGIQWDYIRYPGREWGYSDAALRHYYADTGASTKPDPKDPSWLQWRRDQVTELVRRVHDRIKAIKPSMSIMASTISWGNCPSDFNNSSPYSDVCQDWRKWMNEGLIDANLPMNYKDEKSTKASRQFRNWLNGFKKWNGGRPTYVGIEVHANNNNGVLNQIEAIRKSGLEGYVLFSFNESTRRNSLVAALNNGSHNMIAAAGPSRDAYNKGIRYASVNQIGLAKVQFMKAIIIDPDYAEAYFRLGRCYLKEHNTEKAKDLFEKTLIVDPRHNGARKELAALQNK